MSLPHGVDLGPFRWIAPIARGGMGVVWQGVHRRRGTPVAIKVLSDERARSERFQAGFRREVQAVAGLDHPGIVVVFDVGQIESDAAEGAPPAGSPYLVMELADGSLAQRWHRQTRDWEELRGVLEQVLLGLAHAHARGVIHRDLKPGNLLEVQGRIKLADFGIAHDLHGDGEAVAAGTPLYMAPEQHLRDDRAAGPWTDLYMLGCVAWELATGLPPFVAEPGAVARAHLAGELPEWRPAMSAPEGFLPWLRRLLARNPSDRFQWAADARAALKGLGEAPGSSAPTGSPGFDPARSGPATLQPETIDPATIDPRTLDAATIAPSPADLADLVDAPTPTPGLLAPRPRPAVPEHPPTTIVERPPELFDAGLGLFGLRAVPVVGRSREQAWLWDELRSAIDAGGPRLLLLRGAVGSGKSRLARWLQEAAHEAGVAASWRGRHGLRDGPLDPMVRLLSGLFRAGGLTRDRLMGRVQQTLGRWTDDPFADLVAAVAELLHPSPDPDVVGGPRVPAPAERHETLRRVLALASTSRPVVVWLDDVQWGADLMRWAAHCLARGAGPALFVATVRDEAVEEGTEATLELTEAIARGAASRTIGDLAPDHRSSLVRGLLGLQGELAQAVEERTAGNPLFAVQLVGDWVARGVLEAGERGFALRPGEAAVLPDGIHQVWSARFGALVADGGEEALQIAAALGHQINREEWHMAAAEAEVTAPSGLADQLLGASLAEPREGGFGWVHPMARESLERAAREGGRWARWNVACADMLARRHGEAAPPRGTWERRARHRLEGGDQAGSLAPLLQAARELHRSSDYDAGEGLLARRREQLDALGRGPSSAEGLENAVWVARFGLSRGRDLGAVVARSSAAIAAAGEHATLEAEARHVRAQARLARGEPAAAEDDLERALGLADTPATAAALHLEQAVLRKVQGRPVEGLAAVDRALAADPARSTLFEARAALLRTQLLIAQGLHDDAARAAGDARSAFDAVGSRQGQALADLELGEALRKSGDPAAAIDAYRAAADALGAIGSWTEVYAWMNLAIARRAAGRSVGRALERALVIAERVGSPLVLAMVQALRLPDLVDDPAAWQGALQSAAPLGPSGASADPDLRGALELARARALAAGLHDSADALLEILPPVTSEV